MNVPSKVLHFTLGPVQGFIADARRTRDFWAGSFLLSWLSGQAMAALKAAGGDIAFPLVDGDELFSAVMQNRKNEKVQSSPYIGSLPNRFKADISKLSAATGDLGGGELCRSAIVTAWRALGDAVWDEFLDDDVAILGKHGSAQTRARWDRQVDNFWDMNWVSGEPPEDKSDGQWLDRRKNWRTHIQKDEPGDLCRLMGRYQEMSGYDRIGEKSKQATFWSKLEAKVGPLNIKRDERLCAIALIKRLFLNLPDQKLINIIGWKPGGTKVNVKNWPSVSYIAAVPWLKHVRPLDSQAYANTVETNVKPGHKGEIETNLFGLGGKGIFDLDGHLLHQDGIAAWSADDLTDGGSRGALLTGLKDVENQLGAKASEFYAILIMDGDNIGAKVTLDPDIVKSGLAEFTTSVKAYFDPNSANANSANGVLIYAGGDDVLALLPVDTAIEAAQFLRQKYIEAFKGNADYTLSAAIVFGQYKIPLSSMLSKAHYYIDEIAKKKNGRDSLAIAVLKPGGIAYDWASRWGQEADPVDTLLKVARRKSETPKKGTPTYSASFFYNIRGRYIPLFETSGESEGQTSNDNVFASPEFMEAVLTAEYKKQPGKSQEANAVLDEAVADLLTIGLPVKGPQIKTSDTAYCFDSALLANFIATESRWDLGASKDPDDGSEEKHD